MNLLSFVCIVIIPVVLGFSTYDRNYDRAVENVLRDLREISVQPDQTDEQPDNEDHNLDVTGKDDADKEDHDKEDEGDKEDDYNKEDEGDKDDQHKEDHDDYDTLDHECFDFKALVLNHLIGFPNVRHMSPDVHIYPMAFLPIIHKAVSTFKVTSDADMAAKQMVQGLVHMMMTLTENCPTTMFNKIILYVVGKTFHSVIRQENKTITAIKDLLWNAEKIPAELIMYYSRVMFGNITNALINDVLTKLSENSHEYIKTIYPTIVSMLNKGGGVEEISSFLSDKTKSFDLLMECIQPGALGELYRDVLHDLDDRFGDEKFDAIVSILPLSHVDDRDVAHKVAEMTKGLLSRGVEMAKRILTGLRRERMGLVSEEQRLLSDNQLSDFKRVVVAINWKDEPVDEVEHLPDKEIVHIMVKEEMKDFETLQDVFENMDAIQAMTWDGQNGPDPRVQLTANLDMLLKRKCTTYKKYLSSHGKEIPACSRFD